MRTSLPLPHIASGPSQLRGSPAPAGPNYAGRFSGREETKRTRKTPQTTYYTKSGSNPGYIDGRRVFPSLRHPGYPSGKGNHKQLFHLVFYACSIVCKDVGPKCADYALARKCNEGEKRHLMLIDCPQSCGLCQGRILSLFLLLGEC